MKQLYAGMSNLYNGELPKQEAKWIWSEKKKKYYAKFDTGEHMLILFKTGYLLVFNKEKRKGIIEPVRNYYHMIRDGVAYEVTPTFEIPF